MRRRSEPPEIAALKTRWCRWVDIVELFARRRPGRRRVVTQEYVALHKELIRDCQGLADSANEVEGTFYRYLEDLVRPWLSPSVLSRSDREILVDLLVRCRQAESQLGVRSWARMIPGWAPRALAVSLLAVVGVPLIGAVGGGMHSVPHRLCGWWDVLWLAVTRSSDVERLGFISIVLIIVSIFIVSRAARS